MSRARGCTRRVKLAADQMELRVSLTDYFLTSFCPVCDIERWSNVRGRIPNLFLPSSSLFCCPLPSIFSSLMLPFPDAQRQPSYSLFPTTLHNTRANTRPANNDGRIVRKLCSDVEETRLNSTDFLAGR